MKISKNFCANNSCRLLNVTKYYVITNLDSGNYSTNIALIEFSFNIHRFLDDGNYVIGIFIDFTKAFDTVDHEILLSKLHRYGIRGHANNLFRSYLTNRTQYTSALGVDITIVID